MSPNQLADNPTTEEIVEALKRVEKHARDADKQKFIALFVAAVVLAIAAFGAGFAVHSREIADAANKALANQQHTNRVALCNNARSTALAYREPQVSASGAPEPRNHFIERMLAQRSTLQSIVNQRCGALPGFATFPALRADALREIEVVLYEAAPDRFRRPMVEG